MKLLQELKKKPFCNDFHLLLIPIILLLVSLKYYFFIIFLILYLIYIIKKTTYSFPILVFILLVLISYFSRLIIRNNYKPTKLNAYVYDVINDHSYVIKSNLITIRINDYKNKYKPGDYINIELEYYDDKKSYEFDFDLDEYIYSSNIDYYAKSINSNYLRSYPSLKLLKYNYLNYLKTNLSDNTYQYVSKLVFNQNNLDDEITDSYSILGISHLLAISGLHIMILFKILSFIILKLFHIRSNKIPITIIIIYSLIIGLSPSITRTILFLILLSLNDRTKYKYTRLDILSISMLIMLIYNPYQIHSIGFILSFLVSFILIFTNDLINEKNKVKRLYKSYILIYLITLPFCIKITNRISILSIILSPILSLFLGYILIPLSYLVSILPILDIFLKYVYIFINYYLILLKDISFVFNVKTFNIYKMLIYYLIFIYLIYRLANKKSLLKPIIMYSSFFIILFSINYLNFIARIDFIDCGQGDSSLIRLPNNSGTILIDCYNSYNYLKKEGINNVDYLILTHSDDDHTGDYIKIIEYFNVKNIIYPKYDERFNEILSKYNNKIMVDYNNTLYLSGFKLDIMGPINPYNDPNSDSIVIKLTISNKTLLFTGDMTEIEEKDLINNYKDKLKCDILKVAHHGSITSSSDLFLEYVKPKYSIISVGVNNYGHPDSIVLDRLSKYGKTYITKDRGNITIRIFNGNLNIQTFR